MREAKEKLTIVKVGGAVVENEAQLEQLLKDFSAIEGRKVLVHGGGRKAGKGGDQREACRAELLLRSEPLPPLQGEREHPRQLAHGQGEASRRVYGCVHAQGRESHARVRRALQGKSRQGRRHEYQAR